MSGNNDRIRITSVEQLRLFVSVTSLARQIGNYFLEALLFRNTHLLAAIQARTGFQDAELEGFFVHLVDELLCVR
jgi:hypothetical protein